MRIRLIAPLAAVVCAIMALTGSYLLDIRPVFAEQAQKPAEASPPAVSASPMEAEKGLLAALNRKEKELLAREEDVVRKEERLNIVKADIEQRLTELKREHEEIAALVKKIDEINDQRVKRIVKIYESMNPEEAASRIEKLDEQMAVMILASMSERKAAKVMSFIDVSKSAKLSQSLRIKN
jgi:flagellar motility protein MotE (MotC chaperone)